MLLFRFVKKYVFILVSIMELRVGNKYRLGRKIGSGSFGDIYLGKYVFTLDKKIIVISWFS